MGVFGGILFPHFGHLMVETLSRSWWLVENGDGATPLVLQLYGSAESVPAYARKLFHLAGLNVHFVAPNTSIRVSNLIVPQTSLIERCWAHPNFLSVFRQIRGKVQSTFSGKTYGPRLFVARGKGVAQVFGEEIVQRELERQGYVTLDPSTAPLEDQIMAFANATHIVGSLGSAMHNVVYAERLEKITYLVRDTFVSQTYPAIDQASSKYDSYYFYAGLTPLPLQNGLDGPYLIDGEQCKALLYEAGFIKKKPSPTMNEAVKSRDDYMQAWALLHQKLHKS